MGLTISSLFSRLFGKKQMRILMGKGRQRQAAAARPRPPGAAAAAAVAVPSRGRRQARPRSLTDASRWRWGRGGWWEGAVGLGRARGELPCPGAWGAGHLSAPLSRRLRGRWEVNERRGEAERWGKGGDGDMSALPFSLPRSRFFSPMCPPRPPPPIPLSGAAAALHKQRQSPALCGACEASAPSPCTCVSACVGPEQAWNKDQIAVGEAGARRLGKARRAEEAVPPPGRRARFAPCFSPRCRCGCALGLATPLLPERCGFSKGM